MIAWVPLDNRLQLPAGAYSYLLQQWNQALGAESAFARVAATPGDILGVQQPVDSLEHNNRQMGAAVEAFRDIRPIPRPGDEGAVFVASADGASAPQPAPFVTAWGRPVAGLQAGVRVRADQLRPGPGQALEIEVVVRNIRAGGAFQFPSTVRLSGYNSVFVCHVKDGVADLGRNVSYNGPNPTFTLDIDAGGEARLGSVAVETVPGEPAAVVVNRHGQLFYQWKPGTYRVGSANVHSHVFRPRPVENWPSVKRDEPVEREEAKLGTGYLDVEVVAHATADAANAVKRE